MVKTHALIISLVETYSPSISLDVTTLITKIFYALINDAVFWWSQSLKFSNRVIELLTANCSVDKKRNRRAHSKHYTSARTADTINGMGNSV
jgi:3'-phosphoadenosine 5'-phosphosulfate (PAPS) 3'-phosphatase